MLAAKTSALARPCTWGTTHAGGRPLGGRCAADRAVVRRIRRHVAANAASAAAPATAATCWTPCPCGEALIAWVRRHGGYLDERLTITEQAPCGSRGVVATAPIDATTTEGWPEAAAVLRVPEAIYMTSEAATRILQDQIDRHGVHKGQQQTPPAASNTPAGSPLAWLRGQLAAATSASRRQQAPPPISEVDSLTRLSLLLAFERTKGPDSFWHPYIASLSPAPPCAWLMPPAALGAAVADIAAARGLAPIALSEWVPTVVRAGAVARARAAALASAYGAALSIDADAILWGMAHVVSRAFGDDDDVALAPLIDSCNHRSGAGKPWPLVAGSSGGGDGNMIKGSSGVADGVLVCVSPEAYGQTVALAAGDELFICYGAIDGGREGALGIFLTFGWLPEDVPI